MIEEIINREHNLMPAWGLRFRCAHCGGHAKPAYHLGYEPSVDLCRNCYFLALEDNKRIALIKKRSR